MMDIKEQNQTQQQKSNQKQNSKEFGISELQNKLMIDDSSNQRKLLNRLFDRGLGSHNMPSISHPLSSQNKTTQLIAKVSQQNNMKTHLKIDDQNQEEQIQLPKIVKPNIYNQISGTLRSNSLQKNRPKSIQKNQINQTAIIQKESLDEQQISVRKFSEEIKLSTHRRQISATGRAMNRSLLTNNYQFGYSIDSSTINSGKQRIEYLIDVHTGKLDPSFATACVKKVPYRMPKHPNLSGGTDKQIQIMNDNDEANDSNLQVYEQNQESNVIKLKDIDGFIKLVKENRLSLQEFIYLKKRKSAESDAYNLKVVNYASLVAKGHTDYYTLSCRGLTFFQNQIPVEFIYLGDWLRERDQYNTIKRLSFFRKFRKWKTLKKWGKLLFNQRFQKIASLLNQRLFLAHPVYQRLLIKHNSLCQEFEQLRFLDAQAQVEIQSLDMFASIQQARRANTVELLKQYSSKLHENVRQGLKAITEKLRMQIISEISQEDDQMRNGGDQQKPNTKKKQNKKTILEIMGFPEFLSYGHRSMVRQESIRFLRLAYLLDFYTLNSLTGIYHQSANEFIDSMQEIMKNLLDEDNSKKQEKEPLFYIKLLLNTDEKAQTLMWTDSGLNDLVIEEVEIQDHEEIQKKIFEFDLNLWAELKEAQAEEVFDAKKYRQNAKKKKDEVEEVNVAPVIKKRRFVTNIHTQWLELKPKKEQFFDFFEQCLSEGLESLKVVERWSKNPEFLPYANALEEWDQIIGDKWPQGWESNQYLNPEPWLQVGNQNQNDIYLKKILSIFDQSFKSIDQFRKGFNQVLNLHWRNLNTNYEILKNPNLINPIDNCIYQFQLLHDQGSLFENVLVPHVNLGLFRVDSSNLRKQIEPKKDEIKQNLSIQLLEIQKSMRESINVWMNKSFREMTQSVTKIEDFIQQRDNFDKIQYQMVQIRKNKDDYEELFAYCLDCKLQITKEDKDKQTQLNTLENQLNVAINEVDGQYVKNVERFKTSLSDKIARLQEQNVETQNAVNDQKFLTLNTPLIQALEMLSQLESSIVDQEKMVLLYMDYEEVLQVDNTSYNTLEEVREQFNLIKSLWYSIDLFQKQASQWKQESVQAIDIKKIEIECEKFFRTYKKCDKAYPNNEVVNSFKKILMDVKENIPVITSLKSPYLTEVLQQELFEIIAMEIPLAAEDFTLEKLLALNLNRFSEEISELSIKAYQEYALNKILTQQEQEWDEKEVNVKMYKEMPDMYILGDLEEFIQQSDDSLNIVNGTLANKYIKPLRKRAQTLSDNLFLVTEIIDKWLDCQKRWMYLESIFASKDIRSSLPQETAIFETCDKFLKQSSKKFQLKPKAMNLTKTPQLLNNYNDTVDKLDKVEKGLEDYLKTKREAFPRFYFLSNEELIEILSKSDDMEVIQRNLRKVFEGIYQIECSGHQITHMISPEKEKIELSGAGLPRRGNVENWLHQLQQKMCDTVQKFLKSGFTKLNNLDPKDRKQWILQSPGQTVSAISQVAWCLSTEEAIIQNSNDPTMLLQWYDMNVSQLMQLIEIVRTNITDLERAKVEALITQDVKSRDIIEFLNLEQVQGTQDFNWQKQLRYYWEEDSDCAVVKQVAATINYANEYLGATTRLVITPLTERCWMTITSGLHVGFGSAPAGPAGTGKTETTKDLAKALGTLCVVFNCSDQVTYIMTSRLLTGLASAGAWACLDEFNRIDIEVLSVIAQQLLTIRLARIQNLEIFEFEGKMIPLKPSYGCFITMNPGYAGRTELPDNLKVLFRPVSMMIPDYALIAEIMLFGQGFESAKVLSKKMVQLYNLSSQQLSQQDHYDFGMRAVKSVLVMAGNLKRSSPEDDENVVLIRAMQEANIPKFVKDDLPLFAALIQDLFPNFVTQKQEKTQFDAAIQEVAIGFKLQPVPEYLNKVLQTYETMNVRFGSMLVGPTGTGKSQCIKILAESLRIMHERDPNNKKYFNTRSNTLNPKSISMGELYGEVDVYTCEWHDGLASSIIRNANSDVQEEDPLKRSWIIFDGPVDALWIENMNTVLDDNMTLCLANSERIKLRPQLRILFEVQDLAVASPATVSRCGMVYLSSENLGYMPYVTTWLNNTYGDGQILDESMREYLLNSFENICGAVLPQIRKISSEPFGTNNIQAMKNMCNIIEYFISNKFQFKADPKPDITKKKIMTVFSYSLIWGMCASFATDDSNKIQQLVRETFKTLIFPQTETIFDFYIDTKTFVNFLAWDQKLQEFQYKKDMEYHEIMVPTVDTTKIAYTIQYLLEIKKPSLLTGFSGVGKSIVIQNLLIELKLNNQTDNVILNFSAQTSSKQTQQTIEAKLNKKSKSVMGAKPGRSVAIFVDDINMPAPEYYGAIPVIELLRQYCDYGGFYDRHKLFWKQIQDSTLICAAAPPGGGRTAPSPRFLRHFNILNMPNASEKTLANIFGNILKQFLTESNFNESIKQMADKMVQATISMYNRISQELKPIPSKFHYTFNLRDVSKVFQGILMVRPQQVKTEQDVQKLLYHELARVFSDRLINKEDLTWFYENLTQISNSILGTLHEEGVIQDMGIIYTDLLKLQAATVVYEEVKEKNKIIKLLNDMQDDYNMGPNKLDLVYFDDAMSHCLRITRVIRQGRGSMMLIGAPGSGKQSLAKISAFIMNQEVFGIQSAKNYGIDQFRQDVGKAVIRAGGDNQNVALLLSDQHIVKETFLEDISNLLNTGEVPQMWQKKEELDDIFNRTKGDAEKAGCAGFDEVYNYFVQRTRRNLHVILCMSPVGELLRVRARKFPSLTNATTLDWFQPWPKQALKFVAQKFLEEVQIPKNYLEPITQSLVDVSIKVMEAAEQFFASVKRRIYCTPKNYIIMVKLYISLFNQRKDEIDREKNIFVDGVQKLEATQKEVDILKVEIAEKQPLLEEQQIKTAQFMEQLAIDKALADEQEAFVASQTEEVNEEASKIAVIANDCQKELDKALPAMQEAEDALKSLSKASISEIRTFSQPPPAVVLVLEAVCILLEEKTDWDSAKKVMQDTDFLGRLQRLDKNNISDKTLVKLRKLTNLPEFEPENVGKKNLACKSVALWCIAMDIYSKVYREVIPKKKKVAEMTALLEEKNVLLRIKQDELNQVKSKVAKLQNECELTIAKKDKLQNDLRVSQKRLQNAAKLNDLLGSEQKRWEETIIQLTQQTQELIGNVFLAAATISYLGPFSFNYRANLIKEWQSNIEQLAIPFSNNYTLPSTLEQPVTIRDWTLNGLPDDLLSIDNAVIASKSGRYAFFIDPQNVANKWLKQRFFQKIIECKTSDTNFLKVLQAAVVNGSDLLIEDAGEHLEAVLDNVLDKNTIEHEGRIVMKVGEKLVDYNKNFQLYITTKLSNPVFLPDVFIKTNVINFMVTFEGLEDQLLGDVVKVEKPTIEEERDKIVLSIAADKKGLQQCQDRILYMLATSKGVVLDNEPLIFSLEESKNRSKEIAQNLQDSEKVEASITEARNAYRNVAKRGSVLYFVVQDLAGIDKMYQYSLEYFKKLYLKAINTAKKPSTQEERLICVIEQITRVVYFDICFGLFEAHKKIFSFLISTSINRREGIIQEDLWNLLIRGVGVGAQESKLENPDPNLISEADWQLIETLTSLREEFNDLSTDICSKISTYQQWAKGTDHYNKIPYQKDPFVKLLLIKTLCLEQLAICLSQYVGENMGSYYAESPSASMEDVYNLSSNLLPIIFILSPGADPSSNLLRFSKDKDQILTTISLGQGVQPKPQIDKARQEGSWILLQNCHLSKSYMPELERVVQEIQRSTLSTAPHANFRLYLTSMPCDHFPASILQNGLKLTTEPPKGIRANSRKTFNEFNSDILEHPKPRYWKRLLFGLAFFHATTQERRKFGALGFNVRYEFNESDLNMSVETLRICLENDELDWTALKFLVGEINYGGRVTDAWDRRCLLKILENFISPDALKDNYKFSQSSLYYIPAEGDLDHYKAFINDLPQNDDPAVFGLHENADITTKKNESLNILETILSIQPRVGGGSSSKTPDQVVEEIAQQIQNIIPEDLIKDNGNQNHFDVTEIGTIQSLSTVLLQEMEKFNKLLKLMRKSIDLLQQAIKGYVVMSQELDEMYVSFTNNQVPPNWKKVAYASLKPLASWMKDLIQRVEFFKNWLEGELPKSFWLPGFYFPQGFITGVLQTHARKNEKKTPIDSLNFKFRVLAIQADQIMAPPLEGVYINGLFLDGAKWNTQTESLEDLPVGQLFFELPVIHFQPVENYEIPPNNYDCPVYKTSNRVGVLSTTGQSTNFIISVHLPTKLKPDFWVLRGTAMLCLLNS